jgi:uncharacterized membrane protein YgdD (TMEM256/DUF423 family)
VKTNFRLYAFLCGLFGFAAVAIGAFGAHRVKDPEIERLIEVGSHYHLTHTLAAIGALAFWHWGATRARYAVAFFFGGIWLFSGSLYLHALGAPGWIGFLTPVGGVLFLIGWALLAWAGLQLAADKGASS